METFRIPKGELLTGTAYEIIEAVSKQSVHHKVKVTIQMDRADRSEEQNAALFGVAYKVLSAATGYRKEELHEVFCESYFGRHEYEILGKKHSRPIRTTTTDETGVRDVISKIDFANFYTHIQQVASESLNCYVPDPDKNWRANLENAA